MYNGTFYLQVFVVHVLSDLLGLWRFRCTSWKGRYGFLHHLRCRLLFLNTKPEVWLFTLSGKGTVSAHVPVFHFVTLFPVLFTVINLPFKFAYSVLNLENGSTHQYWWFVRVVPIIPYYFFTVKFLDIGGKPRRHCLNMREHIHVE